jgi:hypothetical protein
VGARALALTAGVLFVLFWGIGLQQYVRDVQIIQTEMVAAARWLDGHLPPEELLAVHDIGAVGYYAPRPILDMADWSARSDPLSATMTPVGVDGARGVR